jgi:hypothetical protein
MGERPGTDEIGPRGRDCGERGQCSSESLPVGRMVETAALPFGSLAGGPLLRARRAVLLRAALQPAAFREGAAADVAGDCPEACRAEGEMSRMPGEVEARNTELVSVLLPPERRINPQEGE